MKRYLVWCPELSQTQDDAFETDAVDAHAAACKWAKEHDEASCDYSIAKGEVLAVAVAETGIPNRQVTFIVSGECVAQYSARLVVKESSK